MYRAVLLNKISRPLNETAEYIVSYSAEVFVSPSTSPIVWGGGALNDSG